ncbi:MAG: DUF3685 domain-containing protein [Cyanobium sp.]
MPRRDPPASAPTLLLFADALQREGLRSWLEETAAAGAPQPGPWRLCLEAAALDRAPALVLWSLQGQPEPAALARELLLLQERWQPAPLLLLLPGGHPYSTAFLLGLPVMGLLEDPDRQALRQAVEVLLAGGRVTELHGSPGLHDPSGPRSAADAQAAAVLGLGGWLLHSGLQQIDAELRVCDSLLEPAPASPLALLLLLGRRRELLCARRLLLWLWGPLQMAWPAEAFAGPTVRPSTRERGGPLAPAGVAITLRQRSADGLWETLQQRLRQGALQAPGNASGQLLALEALHPDRRSDLLLALLEQFSQLRVLLRSETAPSPLAAERPAGSAAPSALAQGSAPVISSAPAVSSAPAADSLPQRWQTLQPELRRAALRRLAGSYVQLPRDGRLEPVAERLLEASDLEGAEPDLPDPDPMLGTLVQARPLLVEGRLLAPDEPQALLYLELLLSNWLIRNAERISAEILAVCADWPELRRYLLRPDLLATRHLERLRNQLNAQQRWASWVERPIQIYESRRPLFQLQGGAIASIDLSEPRDRELRRLGWPQQLVTLTLETRDALAPQLQALVRSVGHLVVVLLTQVIGRAIGLIGRGVLQGLGRSGSRDRAAQ